MAKKTPPAPSPPQDEIRVANLAEALGERYLSYALSTIVSRSLPDVRDGLKPVHRRVLYAMRQLRLEPGSGYKKSARVVGDVVGQYHPHGEVAIYDAMVRLAQDFAQRYPLVDGQGNFGNIDGDNAAAMRYTEARLTEAAGLMLQDIEQETVDFRPTYNGEALEPTVLPAGFPNLLANGAQGIAVGMATSVPPHNVAELCDALLHLIKFPSARIEKIVELVPGPDFPTGGTLCEGHQSIIEAYRTGRGSFRVRAKWETENLKGGLWRAIVTEIPYQVAKSKLIEKIAQLLQEKKLPLLDDVADESAADIRIVLTPKSRNIDSNHMMEQLFRQTDLESRFALNLNVLDAAQTPRVMSLSEALRAYLDHRREVLVRRTGHRLAQIDHRLEVLDGYQVAFLNIDEVIRIIRSQDEPKPILMARWKLSEIQAEAILNLRLRALRKLEEAQIRAEHRELTGEKREAKALLASADRQWEKVALEIAELKKRFGPKAPIGRRRTEIGDTPAEIQIPAESLIEREPATVICSDKGWIRAMRGHVDDETEIKFKEGDRSRFQIKCETTDKLLAFGTNGKFYTLSVDKLPGGRGHGEPVRLMIDLGNDQDIVRLMIYKPGQKLLVAAADARGFVVNSDDVVAQTKSGKQVLTAPDGVEAQICVPVEGDMVACIGQNRKLLIFPLLQVPEMARGRGAMLQRYKEGGLSDVRVFFAAEGLSWRLGDKTRTETNLKDWIGERAQAGRLPPNGFPRGNRFS
jgi:topoisomerase-4 subunit A